MKTKDIFLCHATEDKPLVQNLQRSLERFGVSSWMDDAEMHPGDLLLEKISVAIQQSRWFLIVITGNSVKKEWIKFEISQALELEGKECRPFIIPVILSSCILPEVLANKVFVDLQDFGNYDAGVQKIIKVIKGDIINVPHDFKFADFSNFKEDEILKLPRSQAILELNLRAVKFIARTVRTLSINSGLTQKQVISYCQASDHIILSPVINVSGNIYYGLKKRLSKKYSSQLEYENAVYLFTAFLNQFISESSEYADSAKFLLVNYPIAKILKS